MEDKAKRRVVVIVVALLSMTLGVLGTGYALKRNCIEPDVSLTVNKFNDDQNGGRPGRIGRGNQRLERQPNSCANPETPMTRTEDVPGLQSNR